MTRSFFPLLGAARQTVNEPAVASTPVGWKTNKALEPFTWNPVTAGDPRYNTLPPLITIQPCSQPPAPQVVPVGDTHMVTGVLRLMASPRAKFVLAIKS